MNNCAINSISKHTMTISGYASVFNNIDSQGDIILAGAFGSDIGTKAINVKFLWQHDQFKPIGIIKNLKEDDYGLFIEAEINLNITQGKEAAELLKHGALNSFSIGFHVKNFRRNEEGKREIINIDLKEVSLVTFPANPKAKICYIKKEIDQYAKLSMSLDKLIKKFQQAK